MEDQPRSNDSIGVGFAFAFCCQIVILVAVFLWVGLAGTYLLPLLFWGLLQWIALLSLYLLCRSRAYPLRAKGVLIAGFLGMLLNVACAALVGVRL